MATGRLLGNCLSGNVLSLNVAWGGGSSSATLSGVVSVGGVPSKRPITLYEATSGVMIAQVWSDASGNYSFKGLSQWRRYQVMVVDYPTFTHQDKAALQTPGVWTLNINLDDQVGSLTITNGAQGYAGWTNVGSYAVSRANALSANPYFGGTGVIRGRVFLSGVGVKRQVRLYDQSSGVQAASTWTDDNGYFAFIGVSTWRRFMVTASDYPNFSQPDAVLTNVFAQAGSDTLYPSSRLQQVSMLVGDAQAFRPTWGGGSNPGVIAGTVKIGASLARRKVRLYDHTSGFFIQETWSDTQGNYSFKGLNKSMKYTVTATDYPNYNFDDVIACNITPV